MKNDPQPLGEVIYFLIEMTSRKMRRYSHQVMREAGLEVTIDQFIVLKMLEEQKTVSQSEMAHALYKDNASITRIVELLVNKGMVTRMIGTEDRRSFRLELTPTGKDCLEKAKPIVFGLRRQGVEAISEEELEITKETLRKIRKAFE